jgi:hypothetical protein
VLSFWLKFLACVKVVPNRLIRIFASFVWTIILLVVASDGYAQVPIQGRVETFSPGSAPKLPEDFLVGGLEERAHLPASLCGKWYGTLHITQIETYPELHRDAYSRQFIDEINKHFYKGKSAQLILEIKNTAGGATVAASDLYLARGFRIKLTTTPGAALVPGGRNYPSTVREMVTELSGNRIEHTRIDFTRIVDEISGQPLQQGYTEVSAVYEQRAPKRIRIKLLNVDYDKERQPLWKVLFEGEATK